jgi:hypothetical protein
MISFLFSRSKDAIFLDSVIKKTSRFDQSSVGAAATFLTQAAGLAQGAKDRNLPRATSHEPIQERKRSP